MNQHKTKFGVVFGCPRSGTTFLMGVLDRHPDALCKSGGLLPVCIPHLLAQELPEQVRISLQDSLRSGLEDYLHDGEADSRYLGLKKWYRSGLGVARIVEMLQNHPHFDIMIYKEPFIGFSPYWPFDCLPQSQIIHIFRDGRDVADSLVRTYDVLTDERLMDVKDYEIIVGRKWDHRYVPWWVASGDEAEFLASTPYVRAIWMWREIIRRCRAFTDDEKVVATGRVLTVRYEDLVAHPPKQGEDILSHFGLTMTPSVEAELQKASLRSIGIHKRRDPGEIAEAERIANAELRLLGYLQ